ncbi:MAG: hypothetical protein ACKVW3_14130 [Phycisphaerales bacterium]
MRTADDILRSEGFAPLGHLRHDLDLSLWWHQASRIQLIALDAGAQVLIKASKAYALVSSEADEELWARDFGAAQDYLESHFREVHLSWSFFRDVPAFLAERHAKNRRPLDGPDPTPEMITRRMSDAEARLRSIERLQRVESGDSPLVTDHLRRQEAQARSALDQLRALLAQAQGERETLGHLQQEYRRKGSAMCLLASIASNLQLVSTPDETRDGVRAVVKELFDAHRFQVTQTFGGRLKIKLAEVEAPALAWID